MRITKKRFSIGWRGQNRTPPDNVNWHLAGHPDHRITPMARTYLVFGDIEGKLDVLRVECTRCSRKGRYSIRKLIEKYGRRGHMLKWRNQRRLSQAGRGTIA